jgi:hypothetical protein
MVTGVCAVLGHHWGSPLRLASPGAAEGFRAEVQAAHAMHQALGTLAAAQLWFFKPPGREMFSAWLHGRLWQRQEFDACSLGF